MKYILLDFGNVLAYPTTGEWFITPKFMELVDMNKIDMAKLKDAITKYSFTKDGIMETLDSEYIAFCNFYRSILSEANYKCSEDIIDALAYNFTFEDDKYIFYDSVDEELKELSKYYKLILLTDNWPCVIPILRDKDLDKYFDKIYISSFYGVQKKDGLFDYPIRDYNIKKGAAIFIDDNEELIKIGNEKGLDVRLMSRDKQAQSSYKVIHDLGLKNKTI